MIRKGVILAGGTGSRLRPATRVTNKHLLPIYTQPMIYYPLQTLQKMGIVDILIVCGENHAGDFAKLLKSGREWGLNLTFRVQEGGDGGVADALSYAEAFSAGENVAVILGDNLFSDDLSTIAQRFQTGAHIFTKRVDDPRRFGVATLEGDQVRRIVEKPQEPESEHAITGLYLFDREVFSYARKVSLSVRGELEIADVLQQYLDQGTLRATKLSGEWRDAGTPEDFFYASALARRLQGQTADLPEGQPEACVWAVLCVESEHQMERIHEALLSLQTQRGLSQIRVLILTEEGLEPRLPENLKEKVQIQELSGLTLASGLNTALEQAQERDFILSLSPQATLADPYALEKMLRWMTDERVATVGPKALRVRDTGDRTETLESTGMLMSSAFVFYDRGIGRLDTGQYDDVAPPLGFSAAAVLYRVSALREIGGFGLRYEWDKVDVDIALRLRRAGYTARLADQARAYTPALSGPRDMWGHVQNFLHRDPDRSARIYRSQLRLMEDHLSRYPRYVQILGRLRGGLQGMAVRVMRLFG